MNTVENVPQNITLDDLKQLLYTHIADGEKARAAETAEYEVVPSYKPHKFFQIRYFFSQILHNGVCRLEKFDTVLIIDREWVRKKSGWRWLFCANRHQFCREHNSIRRLVLKNPDATSIRRRESAEAVNKNNKQKQEVSRNRQPPAISRRTGRLTGFQ
jgi:hypothetical protein